MDDSGLPQPLVALPARRLGEGEVDLHVTAAVPEPAAAVCDRGRHVTFEQASVELSRRHVRDHGA